MYHIHILKTLIQTDAEKWKIAIKEERRTFKSI